MTSLAVATGAIFASYALIVVAAVDAGTPRIVRTYRGITCTWPKDTDGVACQRADGSGFAVGVAREFVLVRNARGRTVFFRNQPTRSPGFKPLNDPRIFHRETHRGVICYWTRLGGGGAGCHRADLHGFGAFLDHNFVAVVNEASKTVFLRNQP